MKTAAYKLAGDIPKPLLGTTTTKEVDGKQVEVLIPFTINTPEAETDEEFLGLMEGPDTQAQKRKLAQGQFDIIIQRNVRNYLNSDDVLNALFGTNEPTADTPVLENGVGEGLKLAQAFADGYRYGGANRAPGATAVVKAKAAQADQILAAAAADPSLAKKLTALGIKM